MTSRTLGREVLSVTGMCAVLVDTGGIESSRAEGWTCAEQLTQWALMLFNYILPPNSSMFILDDFIYLLICVEESEGFSFVRNIWLS